MSAPRKSFSTKKGTELPILNLKGREYLQVMHRIQWFREENPKGSIKTQMIEKAGAGKDAYCVFRAEIYLDTDKGMQLVATGHKQESMGGFADYIEKAESGSIGRALAMCGYGTQFASDDLDEGDRLADSPTPVVVGRGETAELKIETVVNGVTGTGVPPIPAKRSSFRKSVATVVNNDDI